MQCIIMENTLIKLTLHENLSLFFFNKVRLQSPQLQRLARKLKILLETSLDMFLYIR